MELNSTGDGAERRVEAAIEKRRLCKLGCGLFGKCEAPDDNAEVLGALKALSRGISTCPRRPLASCHTSQEIDEWWMRFIAEQDKWVRMVAGRALEVLTPSEGDY